MSARLLSAFALAAMLMLGLAACSREYTPPAEVTRAEVLGTWTIDRDDSVASVELREDGSAHAAGWPPELMCVTPVTTPKTHIEWGNPQNVTGTFVFAPPSASPGTRISLTLIEGCGVYCTIYMNDEGALYFNLYIGGDPDLKGPDDVVRFVKTS